MQSLDLNKLTPWNLDAEHPLFMGNLSLSKANLKRYTFTELAYFHKSPTIGVELEDITREAKAQNKFLGISASAPSIKPLRPDLSDIEIALIHSSHGNIPEEVLATMLNITKVRLRQIRKATEALYHQKDTPLPTLPLVTITDTSKYWTDDELFDAYQINRDDIPSDYGITYKDLLRSLEVKSKSLQMGVNTSLYDTEINKDALPRRTTIPSEISEEDQADYHQLSNALWAQVSRAREVPRILSFKDGAKDLLVDVYYRSTVNLKRKGKRVDVVLDHYHTTGGYNSPLNVPKVVVELAVIYYNAYIMNDMVPPALERIVINLLVSLQYTSEGLGFNVAPLSSHRGHCMTSRSTFIKDSPPLIYPKFAPKDYGYGVVCHHCSTFLSENTTNSCKHMHIESFLLTETAGFGHISYQLPQIYLYSKLNEGKSSETSPFSATLGLIYSLYYYKKDIYGHIHSVYVHNLLKYYTNYSLPVHTHPYQ